MGQIVLSIVLGSLIGFSLGLLGGGGSILTVPILVYIIGEDVHSATGTSLAIVSVSALIGAIAHVRSGNVQIKSGLIFGAASMIGTIPGVWLNRLVAGKVILLFFGLLMIVLGVGMLRNKTTHQSFSSAGAPFEVFAWKRLIGFLALGFAVGLLTGFFGVGGGFLIVPALVLAGHLPTHKAVGTSLLVIVMTSVSGFLGHLRFGAVDIKIVELFALGSLAGVLSGTALAGRMSGQKLSKAFGWFIIIVALYLIYKNLFL